MNQSETDRCPLCDNPLKDALQPVNPSALFDFVFEVRCPCCGHFKITEETIKSMRRVDEQIRRRASALTYERHLHNLPRITLHSSSIDVANLASPYESIDSFVKYHWPKNFTELIERVLLNMAAKSQDWGEEFKFEAEELALFMSSSKSQRQLVLKQLTSNNLIETIAAKIIRLTPKGWISIDELEKGKPDPHSKDVFVAMWFSSELDAAYNDGISRAIQQCGFDPIKIDGEEFLGDIVGEIMRRIRGSRFVVADFTGHRAGVYFEMGFALGHNIPVIPTCRQDCIAGSHFDTDHFNHVVWERPQDLNEKLTNRILAIIGPYVPAARALGRHSSV